jgi:hypothetical protein
VSWEGGEYNTEGLIEQGLLYKTVKGKAKAKLIMWQREGTAEVCPDVAVAASAM